MNENYFYKYGDGPESGPFTLNEMRSKFINEEISSTVLVKKDGDVEWIFAGDSPEINDNWAPENEQRSEIKQYLLIIVLILVAVVFTTGYYYRYYYGVPGKIDKSLLVGTYKLQSSDRGSQLDITEIAGNIFTETVYMAKMNSYYEFGRPEEGMVNMCDMEGELREESPNTYRLSANNSAIKLNVIGKNIKITALYLDGCGADLLGSVVGIYKKEVK